MRFENVLFDLDGTITNSFRGITNSIIHSLKYYPDIEVPPRSELLPFIGPPLTVSYCRIFGMDERTAREAVEHYREYYSEKGIFELDLYDGIAELLKELSEKGCRVILATSKPEVFAKRILEKLGILQYFSAACGDTFDGRLGNKKDIIAKLIEDNGLDKEKTVMVGDTHYDARGAQENGIRCIEVTYGFGETELTREFSPYKTVDSVSELRAVLLEQH